MTYNALIIFLLTPVPPEEPQITDLDANELKGLVGPFNEGDELKLICTTNGGKDMTNAKFNNAAYQSPSYTMIKSYPTKLAIPLTKTRSPLLHT